MGAIDDLNAKVEEYRKNNKVKEHPYMLDLVDRKDAERLLKRFYAHGYRYIVRETNSPFLGLYSTKPKRYKDIMIWGYPDADLPRAFPCQLIHNLDITEINWTNKSATLIADVVDVESEG